MCVFSIFAYNQWVRRESFDHRSHCRLHATVNGHDWCAITFYFCGFWNNHDFQTCILHCCASGCLGMDAISRYQVHFCHLFYVFLGIFLGNVYETHCGCDEYSFRIIYWLDLVRDAPRATTCHRWPLCNTRMKWFLTIFAIANGRTHTFQSHRRVHQTFLETNRISFLVPSPSHSLSKYFTHAHGNQKRSSIRVRLCVRVSFVFCGS